MTTKLIHRSMVLVLNRQWMPIDTVSPAEAFGHLAVASARALRISEDAIVPLDWEAWRKLEVRTCDQHVGTPSGPVVIPAVVLLSNFDRVPMVVPSFGFRGLWERDGGRCQYSGRLLKPFEANIDHVLPRCRGGLDSWENCVLSDRRINTRKGARTPVEAGLRLLREPRAPLPVPATARIRNFWNIPEWNHFLQATA